MVLPVHDTVNRNQYMAGDDMSGRGIIQRKILHLEESFKTIQFDRLNNGLQNNWKII